MRQRTIVSKIQAYLSHQIIRLSKRIGRPLPAKFDKSLDSSCPGGGREFGDPIDWEVGQARKDGAQVVANRDTESPASFDNRDDSGDPWTSSLAADVQPILTSDRYPA